MTLLGVLLFVQTLFLQRTECSDYPSMVEARGVEPLSENPFTQLSPGAANLKISPHSVKMAKRRLGSLFMRDRYRDNLRFTFTTE